MGRTGTLALVAALLSCGSGCGTVMSLMDGTEGGTRSLVYGGTRVDAIVVAHMFSGDDVHGLDVFWLGLVFALDLPLSLAADTLTLPYTLGVELFERPAPEPAEGEDSEASAREQAEPRLP